LRIIKLALRNYGEYISRLLAGQRLVFKKMVKYVFHYFPYLSFLIGLRTLQTKKGYREATLFNIIDNNMGMPYDYSLSHHQLLFKLVLIICATNMNIVLSKCKPIWYFYCDLMMYE